MKRLSLLILIPIHFIFAGKEFHADGTPIRHSAKGSQNAASRTQSKKQKSTNRNRTRRQRQIAHIKSGDMESFKTLLTHADAHRSSPSYIVAAHGTQHEEAVHELLVDKLGEEKLAHYVAMATIGRQHHCRIGDLEGIARWINEVSLHHFPELVRSTIRGKSTNQLAVLEFLTARAGGKIQLLELCDTKGAEGDPTVFDYARHKKNQAALDWLRSK